MASNSAYEFDYGGKHYRWDRSTLRSPEGREEIQRVLTARVKELEPLGYTMGYANLKGVETAKHVLEALALPNGGGEAIFRAIEEDISEQLENAPAQEETEVAAQPTNETAPPTAPGLEAVRGMNEIAKTAEGRIALQRWRNGQDLDPAQSRLVEQYRSYEKQHNDAADASRVSKEPRKNLGTYIPGDVMPFATNQNKVQRLQQAAGHRVKVLNNPAHPYWNASSGEHKSAVLGMKIAQEMLQNGGDSFVHINPDGSIEDEK